MPGCSHSRVPPSTSGIRGGRGPSVSPSCLPTVVPGSQGPGCWEGFPAAPLPDRHPSQPPGALWSCHQPEPCLRVRVTRKSRTPLPLSLPGRPPGWPRRRDRPGRRDHGLFNLLLILSHEVVTVRVPSFHPSRLVSCDAAPRPACPLPGVTALLASGQDPGSPRRGGWPRWLCGCSSSG